MSGGPEGHAPCNQQLDMYVSRISTPVSPWFCWWHCGDCRTGQEVWCASSCGCLSWRIPCSFYEGCRISTEAIWLHSSWGDQVKLTKPSYDSYKKMDPDFFQYFCWYAQVWLCTQGLISGPLFWAKVPPLSVVLHLRLDRRDICHQYYK